MSVDVDASSVCSVRISVQCMSVQCVPSQRLTIKRYYNAIINCTISQAMYVFPLCTTPRLFRPKSSLKAPEGRLITPQSIRAFLNYTHTVHVCRLIMQKGLMTKRRKKDTRTKGIVQYDQPCQKLLLQCKIVTIVFQKYDKDTLPSYLTMRFVHLCITVWNFLYVHMYAFLNYTDTVHVCRLIMHKGLITHKQRQEMKQVCNVSQHCKRKT